MLNFIENKNEQGLFHAVSEEPNKRVMEFEKKKKDRSFEEEKVKGVCCYMVVMLCLAPRFCAFGGTKAMKKTTHYLRSVSFAFRLSTRRRRLRQ